MTTRKGRARDFNTAFTGSSKDEWLTPIEIVRSLGEFDLDPCSPTVRPWDTAAQHYDIQMDGLSLPWTGRVWLNPPYGRMTFRWLERLAQHGDGIALIFARTETKGFHAQVWERADAVFFYRGRLRFYHVDGRQGGVANAPSVLIAYGDRNVQALSNLADRGLGAIIRLRPANDNTKRIEVA